MHDAVQIEAEGVPATVVITDPFQGLAANFASTLGMPGYHNIVVPHPIASKDEAALKRCAMDVVDLVTRQLIEEQL